MPRTALSHAVVALAILIPMKLMDKRNDAPSPSYTSTVLVSTGAAVPTVLGIIRPNAIEMLAPTGARLFDRYQLCHMLE